MVVTAVVAGDAEEAVVMAERTRSDAAHGLVPHMAQE